MQYLSTKNYNPQNSPFQRQNARAKRGIFPPLDFPPVPLYTFPIFANRE